MPVVDHGRTVGRYALREELGAGGFATVYRAHDPVLDRAIALKVLHPHLSRDAATRDRFIREGRALARVRHPNIVQVFDAGEVDGAAYLAMELIEGRSLASIAGERGTLTLSETIEVTGQVGSALAAVHARNLIHRDVKPANIIIEGGVLPGGRAVLLDLGVARSLDATGVTATGLLIGTPGFMAPEQVEPDVPVTPLVDVYQLGATAYMLLAGRPPFEGEATRVLYAIVHRPAPDLGQMRPDLPPGVVRTITASLAKDPALRPRDTVEFASLLRASAEDGGADAHPWAVRGGAAAPGTVAHLQAQSTQAARQPHTPPPGWDTPAPPARRPLWPWLAGGAAALALVMAAAALILTRDSGDTPRTTLALTAQPPTATATVQATATAATPTATVTRTATALPTATATAVRTATPTPTAVPTATAAPTPAVAALLQSTMESRGFVPDGNVVQVRATDAGGTLSVQKGICKDSANGRCQQLFIYLDERFLGTDTLKTSAGILDITALGTGRFSARYANYAPNDPGCCPSLPAVTVTYTWDGSRLTPDRTPPGH